MNRSLSLRKETLAALSADDLASVAGGAPPTFERCQPITAPVPTMPIDWCVEYTTDQTW